MEIPPEMLAAKAALEQSLPFVPGVVGIDIGLREVGVSLTDELVIRVFVVDEQNIPFALQQLIASTPFPIVVVQRDFTPLADTGRYETIVGGISIAAGHGPLALQEGHGTLGGLAHDTMFPGPLVGVSCAHVIATSSTEAVVQGDPVVQPEGSAHNSRRVGQLLRWSDDLDVAVCSIDAAADMSVIDLGPYAGTAEAKVGDIVRKRGRTTLLTMGRVSGIELKVFGREGLATAFEVWSHATIPPIFCDHGDSGSLVINEHNQVVGLLVQAGLPIARFTTWGVARPEFVSGFAVQILPAAAAVGIAF